MTISEALAVGGQTTIVGLSTVFSVLIILMLVLAVMKYIFYTAPNKKAQPTAAEEKPVPVEETVKEPENEMDNDELVAVITAAVAASLNTSTYNLQIKSLRRISSAKSAWNKAGISETINSRF